MDREEELESEAPATVFRCSNHHFLWRKDDIQAVRQEQMYVPLTGSLPRSTRQNNLFGLPGLLSPEQVATLMEAGKLSIKKTVSERNISDAERSYFCQQREKNAKSQANEMMKVRQEQIAEGVRRHLLRTGSVDLEDTSEKRHGVCDIGDSSGSVQIPDQDSAAAENDGTEDGVTEGTSINEPCQSSLISRPNHEESVSNALQQPAIRINFEDCYPEVRASKFSYPQTESECHRWMVFKHLCQLGFFICGGLNFGADFIIYEGDPLIVHSCCIVLVVPYQQRMSLTQLVSAGRLASKARKTVLLASYLRQSDEVRLMTFQWSGIS